MDEKALAALKDQVAERLRPVCDAWPAEVFDAMVHQIASITLRYDFGAGVTKYDRRSTQRVSESLDAAALRKLQTHENE